MPDYPDASDAQRNPQIPPIPPTTPAPAPYPQRTPDSADQQHGTFGYQSGSPTTTQFAPPPSFAQGISGGEAPWPSTPNPPRQNGFGIASLVLGIVAFLGVFIPFINGFSAVLALVGLVLGIVGLVRVARSKGLAVAGTIVSGISLLLAIVMIVVYSAAFADGLQEGLRDADSSSSSANSADEEPASPVETALPVEEEEEVEEVVPPAEEGTRENPAPIGTTIEMSDASGVIYEITLGTPNLQANDLVAAENQFNDPAPAGFQYALVPVTVKYVGQATGNPWIDITVEYVSAAGTTHTQSDTLVVDPAPSFMDINELYPGASGTGNIVIAIPSEGAADGAWAVSDWFTDPFFFKAQ